MTKRKTTVYDVVFIAVFVIVFGGFFFDSTPPEKETVEIKVTHHPKKSEYYVIDYKEKKGKEVTRHERFYGREGKWFSFEDYSKEGKIFGNSKRLDAILRKWIEEGKIREKDTLYNRAKKFIHKDRKKNVEKVIKKE